MNKSLKRYLVTKEVVEKWRETREVVAESEGAAVEILFTGNRNYVVSDRDCYERDRKTITADETYKAEIVE
jgi:hypothetical protein